MKDIPEKEISDFLEKIEYVWKKNEEISKLTHEKFNIFSILRKDHEEVMLHSAFLAQLLNPHGSHGFGDAFLKLFVENILDNDFSFETDQALTYCEKTVTDGRIDIYIDNKSQLLLIENKIYADDQYEQLVRYHRHMNNQYKNSNKLLYLTLNGENPSGNSKGGLSDEQFQCISYKEDILKWLSLCLKEATEVPGVRETIKQYINLIKKLTGGLANQMLDKEIRDIIKDNLEVARLIKNNFDKAEHEVQEEKITKIIESIPSLKLRGRVWKNKALLAVSENGLVLAIGLQAGVHGLVAFPDYKAPKKHYIYSYEMNEVLKERIERFRDGTGNNWTGRAAKFSNEEEFSKIIDEWNSDWQATDEIKV